MSEPILRLNKVPPPFPWLPAVKVCGITRPEDIRLCLAERVAYLGLNRYAQSPRFVPDEALKGLLAMIPSGKRVFVDVAPGLTELVTADRLGFDFFQIHFDPQAIPEKRIAMWADCVGKERLWLAPRLAAGTTFPTNLIRYASALLIDGYSPGAFGGTGKTADWGGVAALKSAHPEVRWVVAGGLKPDNIVEAANTSHADVLDLNSGVEDAPGIKSSEKLCEALARLNSGFTRTSVSGTKVAPAKTGIKPPPPTNRKLRL
jgi:phosphoribosylanthranilate isomerase